MTSDLFDLTGHVALVTGGNSGIGLGMAQGLAGAGAHVVIWGTNEERNLTASEQLREFGEVSAMRVDVGDETAVGAAMEQIVAEHGRLDSCFANAGAPAERKALTDTTLDDFHRVTRVSLDGAFVTLREAARVMIGAGNGGSLVGTSSLSARMGQAGGYAYTASKGALIAMIQAAAVELARYKIRANAILPGWVESTMTAPAFADEKFVANVLPRMPVRRWGTGEDFSAIAVYLASPASAFHTGDSILLDGGYAMY
jgi:NAD(P)-dependent dehydrogenase (short-subunit alcohol dehydrogenase family)